MVKQQQRQKRAEQTKLYIAVALVVLLVVACIGLYFFPSTASNINLNGIQATDTQEGSASTPYGESLDISLTTGAETNTGASWLASYSDSDSQNVYTVNGTYKSQEQVTLGYSLSVSYSNVENIQINNLYIKAVDTSDSSEYSYNLATSKSLSGTSPIGDSDSTTATISQHLASIGASSTGATVDYYIYAQVRATGTISGLTLTAEVTETEFATLVYSQESETTSANVTPTVGVASFTDAEIFGVFCSLIGGVLLLLAVCGYVKNKNPNRGKQK
ncbi:MAG: hypothetical protein ACOWW1_09735 [archaeon]